MMRETGDESRDLCCPQQRADPKGDGTLRLRTRTHPSSAPLISAVPLQPFNPTAINRLEGRPVVRSVDQLRLHRALEELEWTGVVNEFNDAARLKDQSVPVPILVTTNGTILAGFGRWRLAL